MSTQTAEKLEPDYHVADLSLAEWGHKEIRIAETEMPGLVSIRKKYAEEQPLKGTRIAMCMVILSVSKRRWLAPSNQVKNGCRIFPI